jgi:hypothetical protein
MAQALRRDEDRQRDEREGHDRHDDAEHAQLLRPLGELGDAPAGGALPHPDLRPGALDALGELRPDDRDRRDRAVDGLLQLDDALAGVPGDEPGVEDADGPAEGLLEAVARDDAVHHGVHQRLGALGFSAAALDEPRRQGVGEVVMHVGRGEDRLRPVLELARVEELRPNPERDRPEDDRQDRQPEQDGGRDPAPPRGGLVGGCGR